MLTQKGVAEGTGAAECGRLAQDLRHFLEVLGHWEAADYTQLNAARGCPRPACHFGFDVKEAMGDTLIICWFHTCGPQ